MLKVRNIYIIICIIFSCLFGKIIAQNHLNSPYSRFGMGDLKDRTSAGVTAMGGTGYTFQSPTTINFINPASYVGFDTLSFLLDASFSWKNHTLVASTTQRGNTMQFDYISCGFSIARWWKTAIGFQPYSIMNYSIVEEIEENKIDTLTQTRTYQGNGGINEVYWGNAFQVLKNFSLGINASFLFGTYSKYRTVEWGNEHFFNTKIDNSTKIKGAVITVGAQYFIPIKEKGDLGLGMVYTLPVPIRATETQIISTYWGKDYNITTLDTLYSKEPTKYSLKMPTSIGGGISWSKKNKYYVGIDFTWKNWSNYAIDKVKDSLSNVYRISIGGSYTSNHLSNKLFPRMTFSLGANFEQTHLFLEGEHINRFGINFGVLFPLKKSKTGFGIVLEYGQLGTTEKELIKENYFTATINIRIHEKWYQRKKLD
ncbi:MAG: hypothetical protein LBL13_13990 [Bacteroidales bacterium]|jgi:hypothetical protein|nr:hypothetical protein [Bacteroidales bacterium]